MHRTVLAAALALPILISAPNLYDPWELLQTFWSVPETDSGCGMDPDGRCQPDSQKESGCGMDPLGRCQPDPQPVTESGCGWDPLGCPNL